MGYATLDGIREDIATLNRDAYVALGAAYEKRKSILANWASPSNMFKKFGDPGGPGNQLWSLQKELEKVYAVLTNTGMSMFGRPPYLWTKTEEERSVLVTRAKLSDEISLIGRELASRGYYDRDSNWSLLDFGIYNNFVDAITALSQTAKSVSEAVRQGADDFTKLPDAAKGFGFLIVGAIALAIVAGNR